MSRKAIGGIISGIKSRNKSIEEYDKNPNYCKQCKDIIKVGNKKVSVVRHRKFCCKRCSAIFNDNFGYRDVERYNAEYYKLNRLGRKERILERQKDILNAIQVYKIKIGCSKCGYNKCPRVLSFHHIGDNKEHTISKMCAQGRSLNNIFKEIEKCILLCMNCHTEIHYEMELSSNGRITDFHSVDESSTLSNSTKFKVNGQDGNATLC